MKNTMKKIGEFLKNNAFYVSMGVVMIAALVAVFFLPNNNGNVKPDTNIPNKEAAGELTASPDSNLLTSPAVELPEENEATDEEANNDEEVSPSEEANTEAAANESEEANTEAATNESEEANTEEAATNEEATSNGESVSTETFDSTTANETEPYFATGDQLIWPVTGKVVVPYRDESDKAWFSKGLNQTMRTFGICISGNEGEDVKAIAKGTVVDILDDSSTLDVDGTIPYVGKVLILDLGNGYKAIYGFQGGEPIKSLKGQVVNVGDKLGTVGTPTGAFVDEGDNIYLQVSCNDQIVDPQEMLETK